MIPREERGPVLNGLPTTLPDVDPEETQEWIESLDKMVETDGPVSYTHLTLPTILLV